MYKQRELGFGYPGDSVRPTFRLARECFPRRCAFIMAARVITRVRNCRERQRGGGEEEGRGGFRNFETYRPVRSWIEIAVALLLVRNSACTKRNETSVSRDSLENSRGSFESRFESLPRPRSDKFAIYLPGWCLLSARTFSMPSERTYVRTFEFLVKIWNSINICSLQ